MTLVATTGGSVAEVFRLDQLDFAVALDDNRQVVLLVAEHRVADAFRQGLVDGRSVLAHDATDVFASLSLHTVP